MEIIGRSMASSSMISSNTETAIEKKTPVKEISFKEDKSASLHTKPDLRYHESAKERNEYRNEAGQKENRKKVENDLSWFHTQIDSESFERLDNQLKQSNSNFENKIENVNVEKEELLKNEKTPTDIKTFGSGAKFAGDSGELDILFKELSETSKSIQETLDKKKVVSFKLIKMNVLNILTCLSIGTSPREEWDLTLGT